MGWGKGGKHGLCILGAYCSLPLGRLSASPSSHLVIISSIPCNCSQEHLRGEALKTNELLRHLWGALPLVSAARADKAAKLARHLGEQRALLRSHMDAHPGGQTCLVQLEAV